MSYAVRNTLILLLFFTVIAGGGGAYIHFVQKSDLEELDQIVSEKQDEYNRMSDIVEMYPHLQSSVVRAEEFIETYDKTLFPTNNPDQIYRYLAEINGNWPRVEFNFVFEDSTEQDQYGIVNTSITGVGSYRAVYNFINRIENSRPVQKIANIQISPINQVGEYGTANFTFDLSSYYNLSDIIEASNEELQIAFRSPQLFYNPFYPLIRDIEPNEENLTNVENSRLLSVSSLRIFLRNQDGRLVNLSPNDQVYLGRLQTIDVERGSASFRLNKGGIIEEITLEVRR